MFEPLRAALDEIETGVVLLNEELTVQFANRAFLRMWRLEEAELRHSTDFRSLLSLVVGKRTKVLPPAEFESYVQERSRLIQQGAGEPRDIRTDDGEVIRVCCKALPDGGRMMTYAYVTDLVRQADQLHELATVDGMTGLFNRRHFLAVAEVEVERHIRSSRPLSLVMIDADRFKHVNDRFGHDIGDHVIVEIASICRQQKRERDIAARFGGEEFLLLLPDTSLGEASSMAQHLRRKVADHAIPAGTAMIRVTISLGVAQLHSGMNVFDLIKVADRALYRAKHQGRNQVSSTECVLVAAGPRPAA